MKNRKANYDFAGWVTKNDIHCSDGVTIRQNAFKDDHGTKVPLVWNHNHSSPNNVLGHVILQNHDQGVYGYGYFNDTDEAQNAKEMVRHGDINSMSIGARKIKRNGSDVIHGKIYEVSLVLSGANPGAMIDSVIKHTETGEEEGIIYLDTLIHQRDDVVEFKEDREPEKNKESEEDNMKFNELEHAETKTVGQVIETLNDDQLAAVMAILEQFSGDDEDDEGEMMKQNIFSDFANEQEEFLSHSDQATLMQGAIDNKVDSFKEYIGAYADANNISHGITNIETLFPEAKNLDPAPKMIFDKHNAYKKIIDGVTKSPFARIKTQTADLTTEEARAHGYIKGKEKIEQFFEVLKRETTPQTIYKKQALDRDDIIDITDFDVVAYIQREMRIKLEEEIARAIIIGDGRELTDDSKIKEDKIRPIISDNDFYTVKKTYGSADSFIADVIKGMIDYRGTGRPTMFVDHMLLADVRLLKGTDGRWLGGTIPSINQLADQIGVGEIVPTTFMAGKGALVVNLSDYSLGASKGGQVTTFDDFDIDFNKYKYLIETRLSGALTIPKSAIHFAPPVDEPQEP